MLTKGVTRKLALPHEPGEWIEINLLGIDDLIEVKREAGVVAGMTAEEIGEVTLKPMLTRCIKAWSYLELVTPDAIGGLDPVTATYVVGELMPQPLSEDERKNAISPSTAVSTGKASR